MIQSVKRTQAAQLRRNREDLGQSIEARPVQCLFSTVRTAPTRKDVPPHIAGRVEGIRIGIRRTWSHNRDELSEERRNRSDACDARIQWHSASDHRVAWLGR